MMLIVRRPFHLSPAEAELWLRDESAALLGVEGVERLTVARLGSASGRWNGDFDWRIDLELSDESDPARIVRDGACAALLGDLRLLGMRPALSLVEDAWVAER
jgi:hypothetical protein